MTQEECPISFLFGQFRHDETGVDNDTLSMGDRKRSSVTFFAVYLCTVSLGRAMKKEQMRGVHKPTTLAQQHDLDPREFDEERIDV